jgi:hypothetical protein
MIARRWHVVQYSISPFVMPDRHRYSDDRAAPAALFRRGRRARQLPPCGREAARRPAGALAPGARAREGSRRDAARAPAGRRTPDPGRQRVPGARTPDAGRPRGGARARARCAARQGRAAAPRLERDRGQEPAGSRGAAALPRGAPRAAARDVHARLARADPEAPRRQPRRRLSLRRARRASAARLRRARPVPHDDRAAAAPSARRAREPAHERPAQRGFRLARAAAGSVDPRPAARRMPRQGLLAAHRPGSRRRRGDAKPGFGRARRRVHPPAAEDAAARDRPQGGKRPVARLAAVHGLAARRDGACGDCVRRAGAAVAEDAAKL